MLQNSLVSLAVSIFFFQVTSASATPVSLDPWDSGNLVADGFRVPFPVFLLRHEHSHEDGLTSLGFTNSLFDAGPIHSEPGLTWTSQAYLIFDISVLAEPITSASLVFHFTGLGSPLGPVKINDITSITPEELVALPAGSMPRDDWLALEDDIGSGESYGSVSVTPGTGVFDTPLNTAAIDRLNGPDNLIAFGVYYDDWNLDLFESTRLNFEQAPRLVVTTAAAQIPGPGTLWLLMAGGAICLSKRKSLHGYPPIQAG